MKQKKRNYAKNGPWGDAATGKTDARQVWSGGFGYLLTGDGRKRSLSKPKPKAENVINNLWLFENPQRLGFYDGRYHPFITANRNTDIGPGIDMSKQTADFRRRAQQGLTPQQINQEVRQRVNRQLQKVDEALRDYTTYPDTVSPQIKEGLADLRWQTCSLKGFPKLLKSVATGNLRGIQEESKTYYYNKKEGKMKLDKRRHDARLDKYFHYKDGGKLPKMVIPPKVGIFPLQNLS